MLNASMLRSRKLWLGAIGTVLFLGLFFARTDFGELGDALARANYWWVIPGIGIWFVSAWFRALRWRVLIAHLTDLSTRSLYPIVLIGYMANNLLPARTGELVRAYILGERHKVSKMSTLGTITVERILDGFVLVIMLATVGAFVGLNSHLRILVIVTAAVLTLGLVVLLWATSSQQRAGRLVNLMVRFAPKRVHEMIRMMAGAFFEGMRSLQSPGAMAAVLLTTVIAWLLEATMYYFVGLSFDLGEPFTTYLLVTGAANLAITVPSTSGGVGPFELATRETLTSLGVASGTASAYAIALHGFLLLPVIVAGLICLWAINISLIKVAKAPVAVSGSALKAAE